MSNDRQPKLSPHCCCSTVSWCDHCPTHGRYKAEACRKKGHEPPESDFNPDELWKAQEKPHVGDSVIDKPIPLGPREDKLLDALNVEALLQDRPESPLQPCGHPMSAIASSDEGTSYCCDCEANGGTSHPHVPAESNISGECDCETVALVVTERDALKAALREARDFVIAIDHASMNRFEPRRVEMVQSIDTLLGETPE